MTTATTGFYVTGGTLRHDAPSYVPRQADIDLHEELTRGEFCYVLTARQMGKSSLMARTAQRLREEGVAVVVLDLTRVGQNLSAEQWYDGLLDLMGQQLDLEDELEAFWLGHPRLGPLQRWLAALKEVVLARVPGRIVLFVDEIDTVRSLPFSTDEFFAGIRECFNRRTQDAEFARLTFCLLGVASPSDLIRDTRLTPFNIGRRIELTDFTEAEAAPLAQGLARESQTNATLLRQVLYWTQGHPYLTQRLCRAVAEDAGVTDGVGVERLCEGLFLSASARERDDNLLFVRERLLRSEADLVSLLDLYGQVRRGKHIADDETNPLVSLLRLSGVTRIADGYLQVRNRIYERVFDPAWITAHMPDAELRRQRAAYRRGLLRASAIAGVVVALLAALALTAVDQARLARRATTREARQRAVAEEGQRALRRTLYAADMSLAQQAWEAGNLGRARELLEAHRPERVREELRGFEWRYLWRLCQDQSLFTLNPHSGWLFAVAFSPDGKTLASASQTLKLWDLTTRKEIATLSGHKGGVAAVAFSPDGKTLASGGETQDRTVRLWDVATRREQATLRGHQDWVPSLAFSPDGKTLATASGDQTVKLWDVAARREQATLVGHEGQVRSVAFSPDGTMLATGSFDQTTRLWDLATRRQLATLRPGGRVAFSPDGKTLATGGKPIRLWDVATRREKATLDDGSWSLAFSPDGRTLAGGDQDHTIKLWDVARRQKVATLKGHENGIWDVAFSPDGMTLATGSHDDTVKLWSAVPKRDISTLGGHRAEVRSVAFSPDSKILATGSGDPSQLETPGDVKLWDVVAMREIATLGRHRGSVTVAFSPGGETLASGYADGRIRLWNVTTEREIATWRGHPDRVNTVAFSPDGKTLATGAADKSIKLWDVVTTRERAVLRGHTAPVEALAFSPDGKTLASCGDELGGTVLIWDLATRRIRATLRGQKAGVFCVAFSPDGTTLATGSVDNTTELWDLARQQPIATLKGHKGWIFGLAFSPDGKTLATGSGDDTVKLWNPLTGREVLTLKAKQSRGSALAFSPDGTILASGGHDGTVRLWRAPTFAETDAPDRGRQTPH